MLYEKKKQLTVVKKKQHVVLVKEIQICPKIAAHDFETKLKQGVQFLKEGKRLKIVVIFGRGREALSREERGNDLFAKIQNYFELAGIAEDLLQEKDQQAAQMWSRLYSLKSQK
jgi:translation initiation factor IF-3